MFSLQTKGWHPFPGCCVLSAPTVSCWEESTSPSSGKLQCSFFVGFDAPSSWTLCLNWKTRLEAQRVQTVLAHPLKWCLGWLFLPQPLVGCVCSYNPRSLATDQTLPLPKRPLPSRVRGTRNVAEAAHGLDAVHPSAAQGEAERRHSGASDGKSRA